MLSEHYSSAEKEQYSNAHTDRGNELEPLARGMYELETSNQVVEVWFVEYDEYTWCSPDWLIWDDWLIEIKCQSDKIHFELLLSGKIDTKYVRQMQMQMYVTGRQRCDFVAYNPNYNESMRIKRVHIDPKSQEKLEEWLESWKSQIKTIINKYISRWH